MSITLFFTWSHSLEYSEFHYRLSYRYQLLQGVAVHDEEVSYAFVCDILSRRLSYVKIGFGDEVTCHPSGDVN